MPVTMRETEIEGVLEVVNSFFGDDRGFFSELYNREVWAGAGFMDTFVQDNLSQSHQGVLRGLHYQIEPHGMGKLVRVLTGAIFDVAVDLRQGSPTFGQAVCRELSEQNRLAFWIPPGFAHGFLALADHTLVLYTCTATHVPEAERAIRWDDPELAIPWPAKPTVVSQKDAEAPAFRDAEHNFTYRR
jgi:dTDP-4-dehydrorhamnose 3,5-epimerase